MRERHMAFTIDEITAEERCNNSYVQHIYMPRGCECPQTREQNILRLTPSDNGPLGQSAGIPSSPERQWATGPVCRSSSSPGVSKAAAERRSKAGKRRRHVVRLAQTGVQCEWGQRSWAGYLLLRFKHVASHFSIAFTFWQVRFEAHSHGRIPLS